MLDHAPPAATVFKLLPCLALAASLATCGGSSGDGAAGPPAGNGGSATSTLSAAAQLGQLIFSDQTLSVSGRQSCATCHVAQFAFASDPTASGPDRGSPVPLGGPGMDMTGFAIRPL